MAATLINLRAWRDDRRRDRQQRFVATTFAMAILGGALVWGAGFYIDTQISQQERRNEFLRQEMAKLDSKIEEIRELRAKRERLLERLRAIQDLQGNRPVIVRVFDELVRVLPDDLYYTGITRRDETLAIQGRAKDNKDVSRLMRTMDRSDWFKAPNLNSVNRTDRARSFDLQVEISRPQLSREGGS